MRLRVFSRFKGYWVVSVSFHYLEWQKYEVFQDHWIMEKSELKISVQKCFQELGSIVVTRCYLLTKKLKEILKDPSLPIFRRCLVWQMSNGLEQHIWKKMFSKWQMFGKTKNSKSHKDPIFWGSLYTFYV